MAFTDPYGLCPPEDTNVGDCADDNLGNAWRVLNKSAQGKEIISRYVASGYQVNTNALVYNRTDHSSRSVSVLGSLKPGALAVGLAHEEVHVTGKAKAGTIAGGHEESAAWEQALGVYSELTGADRKEARARYRYAAERHEKDHDAFHLEKYCSGASSGFSTADPAQCR